MSLHSRLTATPGHSSATRPRATPPKGFDPAVRWENGAPAEISITLPEPSADEKAWREQITKVTGLTVPDHREVVLANTRYWGDPQNPNVYAQFKIVDRADAAERLDLEEIVKVIKKAKPPAAKPATEKALIVSLADIQVGKVASRGGTEELLARVFEKLDALERHARATKADTAYLLDLGDCVESFENVPGQAFTNDLSFPEQLRVARRIFTEFVVRLAKLHPRVVVAGIPSNHAQWRRGKDVLGKSGDDFGIENIVAVSDACQMNPDAFGHVEFRVPDAYEESMAFDIHGTILAIVHGHQVNNPDRMPTWWAGQVHGGQPCADADILLTGHYHHLRVQPTGRSVHTGRSKWWIQSPTLDNGSDWYRVRSGSDSDPGLLTFTVDSNGWDGLKIL